MHYENVLPSLDNYWVMGINYPDIFEDNMNYYQSIEDLASLYVQKIRDYCPFGPYHLGGWSLGGIFAIEVARQLEMCGEKVEQLFLFDPIYKHHVDEYNIDYTHMFVKTLSDTFDKDGKMDTKTIEKMVDVSQHLFDLMSTYRAHREQPLQNVSNILLVRCVGSTNLLANQRAENLNWNYADLFNGLRHFFKEDQSLEVMSILCSHTELLDVSQADELNRLIRLYLSNRDNPYVFNDAQNNISVAKTKKDWWQLRQLEFQAFGKYVTPQSALFDASDLEDGRISFEYIEGSLQVADEMRRTHKLDLNLIIDTLRKNGDKEFISRILKVLVSLMKPSAVSQVLKLTQRLILLRIISAQSLNLLSAFVIEEVVFVMLMAPVLPINIPMMNYLNVAISSGQSKEIGKAFDAGLLLSMLFLPIMIAYCANAEFLSESLRVDASISHDLGQLELTHMLAIVPMLMNVTIEMFYATVHEKNKPAIGALFETATVLIFTSLMSRYGDLDARMLGLALSIGSISRFIYFTQDLLRAHRREYHLGQSFPILLMQQYCKDAYQLVFSSMYHGSTYLTMMLLIAADSNVFIITAFGILRSCFDVMNLPGQIIIPSENILMGRFVQSNQFQNAIVSSGVASGLSLAAAIIPGVILSCATGEMLTKLFIDTEQLPVFIQDEFYSQIKPTAYYFIGLGFLNTAQAPLFNYLINSFAFTNVQRTGLFCYFILANIALITTHYSYNSDATDLSRILMVLNAVVVGVILYQWLKVCSFGLSAVPVESSLSLVSARKPEMNTPARLSNNTEDFRYKPLSLGHEESKKDALSSGYRNAQIMSQQGQFRAPPVAHQDSERSNTKEEPSRCAIM